MLDEEGVALLEAAAAAAADENENFGGDCDAVGELGADCAMESACGGALAYPVYNER
jgi:hypothetical protein